MSTAITSFPTPTYPFGAQEDCLTSALHLFRSGDAPSAARGARFLRDSVAEMRRACATETEWRNRIDTEIRRHPVAAAALGDPFVRHANQKPRGYAGDAVLLDYIYHHPSRQGELDNAPAEVRAVMQFTTNSPAPRAVRNRAMLLASEIDATARRVEHPSVLSLACGHLREAQMSRALQAKTVGRFLAIDQDAESLAVVREDCARLGVEAVEGSVKTVIARGEALGQFDFVYAAGLYDYLNDKVAARLLRALFALVKPGGKVWVANFMPDIEDRGYMEAFMDWWLIYRDEVQMRQLGEALPADEVASMRTFVEHEDNVVFLEAVRRG
ncbi:MAG: class I SAM-dependent methyltransferase [Bryobacterales bacterium]|nr:class I SAM-dependent methyltransferase [Bryobacterales bacterium]